MMITEQKVRELVEEAMLESTCLQLKSPLCGNA